MPARICACTVGVLGLAVFLALVARPSLAVSITNDDPEHLGTVSVDFWIRRVQPGETVMFHPDSFPIEIYGQFPYATMSCEITSDEDVVLLSGEGCIIDGEPMGESHFRF